MADKLWLALVRSLQDGNVVKNAAPGGPTNEMAQMAELCDDYVTELKTTYADCGIRWSVIPGRPQSQGVGLTTLYEIERAARSYLNNSPDGVPSVCLNLHSDAPGSGQTPVSHVGSRIDYRGTHSEAISKAICNAIAPVFDTTKIMLLDGTDYVFAEVMAKTPHVAVLIEHGDHTVFSDNVTLHTKGREIARASLKALLDHYGIEVPVPVVDPWAEYVGMSDSLHQFLNTNNLKPNTRARAPYHMDADKDEYAKLSTGDMAIRRDYTGQIKIMDF